ncbi:Gfo/Idh/MocA family protein [Cytobacillus purgationiresistens]|uniref:Dehydrogenase n=1 Tax=Cytobacillus purgationiresistens TaxID=863449 RepID=A0ABU0AEH9_9BACI|nr:Gfo/Idh/MocA family oxidoreductase [Cytobacillus purgationiresistens]MDQ0269657.1 putative dehydrogenase [Cytobacillus purgationiresistens]
MKVGMIGVGAIGERILKSFLENDQTEVSALCDMNEDRLQAVSREVPAADLYTNHLQMLNDQTIDLVYVAVPPKYHHQIALDIIKSGKHILCEKPLANTIEEAAEMKEAASQSNLVHAMNFPLAYSSEKYVIHNKVQACEIGHLKRIEMNMHFTDWPRRWQQNDWISSREQGGFIREVSPHFIQLIHSLFGELKVISSIVDYPSDGTSCETGFVARLELGNGVPVIFNGTSGVGQKEHLSLKFFGNEGTLDLRNWRELVQTRGTCASELVTVEDMVEMSLVDELLKVIGGEKGHLVNFQDGYEVQKVLEALLK